MKAAWFRKIIFISCVLVWLLTVPCHSRSASPAGVPQLDEMAGAWLPMKEVANPPDVNNFHDMLLVNRDLTSFFCYPEDWLWADGKFRFGCPPVTLTIAGREYPAAECRWYPYRALRRNTNCAGRRDMDNTHDQRAAGRPRPHSNRQSGHDQNKY